MTKQNEQEGYTFTAEQLDTLKELGNIGSGHAITALSKLLDQDIEVCLTAAEIIPFWNVAEVFESPDIEVFGIYSEIPFNSDLSIMQIFSKESLLKLVDLLSFDDKSYAHIRNIEELDALSISIIREIGNILTGHYTSALADLLSIKLVPNVPTIALDSLDTIINSIIGKYSKISDNIVLIRTKMTLSDIKIDCIICFIPCINILKSIFKILNVKYNMNI
jgi:chemotaxis protein CheC